MYVIDWKVAKTTTDKLEGVLTSLTELDYDIHTVAFTGGRDWVVVAERDVPANPPAMGAEDTGAEHVKG